MTVSVRDELRTAILARSRFAVQNVFLVIFEAFARTVHILPVVVGFVFVPAIHADKLATILAGLQAVSSCVNSHVHGFWQRLQVRYVVVVLVEVFVMNIVAVGDFAVVAHPNHAVKTEQLEVAAFHSRRTARAVCHAVELLMRFVDNFNGWKVAFDLANHFFNSKRFLRRFRTGAQQLEKFFFVFHDNASEILTNSRRDVTINKRKRLDSFG